MGEENYEEVRFVTDSGTVIVRCGYDLRSIWLGMSSGRNEDDDPDVVVRLGPGLQKRVAEAILTMSCVTGDE